MKTSKTQTISKPKKTPVTGKAVTNKKATVSKREPTEEEIRAKAKEIYHERIAHGEHGTPENDWHKAEQLLKGSKK